MVGHALNLIDALDMNSFSSCDLRTSVTEANISVLNLVIP